MPEGRRPRSHVRAMRALVACTLAWGCVASSAGAAGRTDRSTPGRRATKRVRVVVPMATPPPADPAAVASTRLWVIDEAGHPQAFADVTLESVDRTWERSALTDERGSVSFTDVPMGRHHASARRPGFTSDAILVDVTKVASQTHSIVVRPEHAAAPPTGAPTGSATLWVIDDAGEPRPSVEVILDPVGDGANVSMTTDAAGRVVLAGLPPGRYHARASLKRFTSDVLLVDIGDAPVRAYSIVVHPSRRHGSRGKSPSDGGGGSSSR